MFFLVAIVGTESARSLFEHMPKRTYRLEDLEYTSS